MKKERSQLEPFSLSFLDIISCGFGAVVMLVLIFKFSPVKVDGVEQSQLVALLDKLISQEQVLKTNQASLAREANKNKTDSLLEKSLSNSLERARVEKQTLEKKVDALKDQIAQNTPKPLKKLKAKSIATEPVAGIPVDRKYVLFIVDTSGSMKQIWSEVTDQITNVLKVHPKIVGFQIMNDNGNYLMSGYAKDWITDTPKMRKRMIDLFSSWSSWSNSSPVEGLETALRDYKKDLKDLSIYVYGDDYTGANFDDVIDMVDQNNQGQARIHAFNFISPKASTDRFSTLMRELTYRNNGAFVSL